MTDTSLIDPATISGTELLLRQKYLPETLAVSSLEPLQASIVAGVPSAYRDVAKASDVSAEGLAEMIEVELRNRQLIELAKQAKKNKGKQ